MIDKRKHYIIVLDTETCNGILTDDKLDLSDSLVYDLGFAVVDKKGMVYETRSFVISEVFNGMTDVMASAYYADKIPQYIADIASGKRILTSFYNARIELLKIILTQSPRIMQVLTFALLTIHSVISQNQNIVISSPSLRKYGVH